MSDQRERCYICKENVGTYITPDGEQLIKVHREADADFWCVGSHRAATPANETDTLPSAEAEDRLTARAA